MKTDDLIASLAARPVPVRLATSWPLVTAALAGLAGLWLAFGAPFAALGAIGAAPYAMKLSFALAVAGAALAALLASGRPGRRLRLLGVLPALPFAALAVLTAMELASAEPGWPGASWGRCLAAIALLTPLFFAAAIAVTRRLAPTRPRLSGALAGIAGSALAAGSYAPWCPETTALFLLSWYAVPIALAGLLGALVGPRLLRW